MMTATRREWSELYTFFTILSQGYLAAGTAEGTEGARLPVALVQRQEHDGTRRYVIGAEALRSTSAFPVRISLRWPT